MVHSKFSISSPKETKRLFLTLWFIEECMAAEEMHPWYSLVMLPSMQLTFLNEYFILNEGLG